MNNRVRPVLMALVICIVPLVVHTMYALTGRIHKDTFINNTDFAVKVWADYPEFACKSNYFVLSPRDAAGSQNTISAGLCELRRVQVHILDEPEQHTVRGYANEPTGNLLENKNIAAERSKHDTTGLTVTITGRPGHGYELRFGPN